MLPNMDCILYHVIYVKSKLAAGIANCKHSHCLFFPLGRLAGNIKLKRGPSHLSRLAMTLLPFKKLHQCVGSLCSLLQHTAIIQSQCNLFLYFGSTKWWKHLAARVQQPLTSPTRKAIGQVRSSKPRKEARCYAHLALAAARTAGGTTGFSRCAPQSQSQWFS